MKRATEREDNMIVIGAISIHALVKRATACKILPCAVLSISIHALVKRATGIFGFSTRFIIHFNPRPREEGDYIIY